MRKDKPQTVNYSNLISKTKNTRIQSETLSNEFHLRVQPLRIKTLNKNNRNARSSQSKDDIKDKTNWRCQNDRLNTRVEAHVLKAELRQMFLLGNGKCYGVQWSCSGVKANFTELQRLIAVINPLVVCLQEIQLSSDCAFLL